MNSEMKHILFSLYTALVYPFSGVALAAGLILVFRGNSNWALGIVLISLGASAIALYRRLIRRKSDAS